MTKQEQQTTTPNVPNEGLTDRVLPPHPFKRDLVARAGQSTDREPSLRELLEESRSLPVNIYVKLREEDKIFDQLCSAGSLVIRGIWRMGKTEMLATMFSRKKLIDDTVSINFQHSRDSGFRLMDPEDFAQALGMAQIVDHITRKRIKDVPSSQPINIDKIREEVHEGIKTQAARGISPLEQLDQFAAQRGERVFIVFDEVLCLSYHQMLLPVLASVVHLEHVYPIYILQKHRSNDSQVLELFPDVPHHFVEPLNLDDSAQIANAFFKGTRYSMNTDAVLAARDWSGGRPFEMTAITHLVVAALEKGQIKGPCIGADDINCVVNDLISRPEDESTRAILEPIFSNYIKILRLAATEDEAKTLVALANAESTPVGEFDASVLARLEKFGLVVIESGLLARINGKIFQHLIRNQGYYRHYDYWTPDEYGNDYI